MLQKMAVFLILTLSVALGVTGGTAATETIDEVTSTADEGTKCVTVYTNPPGAAVDPLCVYAILDDLP